MTTPHTPGTSVAQAVKLTIGGTQAKHHAVGIDGTNVAVAITGLVDADDGAINEANARRIAACWGYCEGLDTEGMQRAVEMGREVKVFIDESIRKELELVSQRDQLLAELEKALDSLEYVEKYIPGLAGFGVRQERIATSRAAIVKVGATT